jgi:hypothetical protein
VSNVGCEEGLLVRKGLFDNLWLLLKSKDSLNFQKSRSKWLQEGDANSSFLHACMKSMKTLVALNSGLKKRVMWLSKAIEVREEVVSYFKKHFEEIT